MKVEILHFEGCPNHAPATEMVERVLRREGIQAEVRTVEVRDAETAEALRFLGSPSVRVNDVDIEPGRENDPPFYGCRTYSVSGKTTGVPPEEWLVDALRRPESKKGSCCRPA
ncbi:MAG: DUF2703 domain-containing protein [Deltaproteobacteria bacterium]|nr:DUF2703 domain-containing protein [Deltaproteobacteria bacterium]